MEIGYIRLLWAVICVLVVVFPTFIEAEEGYDAEKAYSDLDRWLKERAEAPLYTIPLHPTGIEEYRITKGNAVRLKLREPKNDTQELRWQAHSLHDAEEFLQLIKGQRIKAALVRNGEIVEIILNEPTSAGSPF